MNPRMTPLAAWVSGALLLAAQGAASAQDKPAEGSKVSYYKQVRPIFQAQCQGCH